MARARQVRRKRSRKASKGSKWGKIVGFSALGLLLLLLVGALGVYFWVKSYLRSDGFRQRVEMVSGDTLKGEGQVDSFQWSGSSVYTDFFKAQGYQDAWYSDFLAEGIRVDFRFGDSLKSGVWKISQVRVDQVTIDVKDERLPGFHPGIPQMASTFFSRFIPKGVDVDDCRVDRFNFHFEDGREIRLDDAQVKIGQGNGGAIELFGDGGTLIVAGLPNFQVKDFVARVEGGALKIEKMNLGFYDSAVLAGRGTFKFDSEEEPGSMRAEYSIGNLDLGDLVSKDWSQKISGNLLGKFSVSGEYGNLLHRGEVQLNGGVLEALPVLENIAKYTKVDQFRKLSLDKAEVDYLYHDGLINLSKINLVASSLLRVEGNARIRDGVIDGEFNVGVTPSTLKWLPGAHKRVFTDTRPDPEHAGYAWTTMKVKGPLTNPSDDLSARLLEAAGLAILVDTPADTIKSVTGENPLINGGVDTGTGLIESGVDTIKGFLPMFGP